ncbi:MAG: fibronectin type III domain-containing protein, partial [Planctomycetota bacterium]
PPVISAVATSAVTATSATVTWATNEPAYAQVDYGPTAAYGLTTPLTSQLSTTHSVTLTGLSQDTLYHYRVRAKDPASNASASGDLVFQTLPATSPEGFTGDPLRNSRAVYPLPPLPALPAAGGTLKDPTFGTLIMRLTDHNDGDRCWNLYSTWPVFNKDSTHIYIYCHLPTGGERYKIYDFDPVNFTITGRTDINRITPSGAYISGDQAFWSGVDPNILYVPDRHSILYSYNTRTKQYTQLKDFRTVIAEGTYFTRMSMSQDNDNYFAFVVSTPALEFVKHLVWKRDEDKIALSIDRSPTADLYKGATLSKDGKYVNVSYTNNPTTRGELLQETYDLTTGQVVRRLYDTLPSVALSHNDLGRTYNVGWSPLWNKMIAVSYAGDSSQYATLFSFERDWTQSGHTSFRNSGELFAIRETFDANSDSKLFAPTQGFLHNEIFAFTTDGSGKFRRLVHHRSFIHPNTPSAFRYWATPRAAVSFDGRFIVWTSNWENQGDNDWSKMRLDVFIARILDTP